MTKQQKVWCLLAACVGLFIAPSIGVFWKHHFHYPEGFFVFPPVDVQEKPPFSWAWFIMLSVIVLFFMLGFLAELMLRIYFETSRRTPYVIKERLENK